MLSALFLYTLKIMRNINILSGRGIILSGDRQKAGTFVKIAQRRMFEMKQMMRAGNLKYMKKAQYLESDCVWMRLLSIDGADFIRLHACSKGGGCKLKTPVAPGTIISEFVMECPETGDPETLIYLKSEDYYPASAVQHYNQKWWFGTSATSQRHTSDNTSRQYGTGTFYPSRTTYTTSLPPASGTTSYGKEASGLTEAEAFANWEATPWQTPFGGSFGPRFQVRHTGNSLPYVYTGWYFVHHIDLSSTPYTLMDDATAYLYYAVNEINQSYPVGGSVFAEGGDSVGIGETGIIKDLTSSIGSSSIDVTTKVSSYTSLGTPPNLATMGIFSSAIATAQNIYRTSKVLRIKKDGTIEQVGASTHAKVESLNDTFLGE